MYTQEKQTVDLQIIEQINAISKKYDEAVNKNDAAAVAALYTEDAVFVTDTGPLYERQAIEKFYTDVFQQWHPKNHLGKKDPNSPRIIGTADNVASNGEWSENGQGQTGEYLTTALVKCTVYKVKKYAPSALRSKMTRR
jgi:uncharacterized protein (TIGR02246 family)